MGAKISYNASLPKNCSMVGTFLAYSWLEAVSSRVETGISVAVCERDFWYSDAINYLYSCVRRQQTLALIGFAYFHGELL